MPDWVTPNEPFRVGGRLVTPSANEIDGVRVDSKAMDMLVVLAKAAPDVVSTEDLLKEVWPDVLVVDNVVYQAVAQLRKALGDDARASRYIETVPRRGYRLIAPVERIEQKVEEPKPPVIPPLTGGGNENGDVAPVPPSDPPPNPPPVP